VVEGLDLDELTAVLAHEHAHFRALDAWRSILVHVAAALNPAARAADRARRSYDLDREILCDFDAVARGADPLVLASAIVSVARMATGDRPALMPAVTGHHDVDRGVSTRVLLLLGSDRQTALPRPAPRRWLAVSVFAGAVALLLPHVAFPSVARLHCVVEGLVHLLL
jgi:hypothetical protein